MKAKTGPAAETPRGEIQAMRAFSVPAGPACFGPLQGLSVAVQENISLAGQECTAGSRMLEGYRPPFTATAVEKLQQAGAVMVGQASMEEFGIQQRAGQSPSGFASAGPGAAVAAGFASAALGEDSGGSCAVPAARCGVYTLRPTFGRVSRYGLISAVSTLSQISPVAANLTDLRQVLKVISGRDLRDSTTLETPPPGPLPQTLKIALPRQGLSPVLQQHCQCWQSQGMEVEVVDLPVLNQTDGALFTLQCWQTASNLARYDGVHFGAGLAQPMSYQAHCTQVRTQGFNAQTKYRILLGYYWSARENQGGRLAAALGIQQDLRERLAQLFTRFHAIIWPCQSNETGADWSVLAGLPSLTIPSEDLPGGGFHVIGPALGEDLLLWAGARLQPPKGGPPHGI